jgi:hypothetical protein
MPREAPVTRAVLLVRLFMIVVLDERNAMDGFIEGLRSGMFTKRSCRR